MISMFGEICQGDKTTQDDFIPIRFQGFDI